MTIYNKSAHPVEIKKISIRVWALRDEIEAAVERRIKECEAAGVPLYIEDIRKFYNLGTSASNVVPFAQNNEDAADMANLMESLNEKNPLNEANEIIEQQNSEGIENSQPNPILRRPFQRQAPDLAKTSYGFTFLSDINMDTILGFTKEKFVQGQSVVIEFLIPQAFIMDADVTYCHHYALRSRIISSTKPDYRIQSKFNFEAPGQREVLRNFLRSIETDVNLLAKKPREVSEEDSLIP